MTMRNKRIVAALFCATLAVAITVTTSLQAQFPIDARSAFGIYQDGVLVGELMRVDEDPEKYVEHWVLYPDYVYPSERNGVVTEIVPGAIPYDGLDDFFRNVPFEEGSRYVEATCADGTHLPTAY
jgi:hypothetical protein